MFSKYLQGIESQITLIIQLRSLNNFKLVIQITFKALFAANLLPPGEEKDFKSNELKAK
jgi:hypothetical protein